MGIFSKLFGGGSSEKKGPETAGQAAVPDLSEGYSPGYIDQRVRQARGRIIDIKKHARVLAENGADSDGVTDHLVFKLASSVEKVLQNLKNDPSDMSRMGLTLESLDPLVELIGKCAKQAAIGADKDVAKHILKVREGLTVTADTFERLHSGLLQLDDKIAIEGLRRTIRELSQSS